jgi:hypothetical protein
VLPVIVPLQLPVATPPRKKEIGPVTAWAGSVVIGFTFVRA